MKSWNYSDSGLLIALTIVALVCCAMPLFNLLGYESAAVMSMAVSIFVLPYLHSKTRLCPNGMLRHGVGNSPFQHYCRNVTRVWLILLVPAGILSLNALKVPNCDFGMGILFWSTLPTASAALFIAFFHLFNAILPRRSVWLSALVLILDILSFAWRLAMEPPIMGFSWSFGWFAGSIYDEALRYPASLAWHQTGMILLALNVVLGLELFWRRRSFRGLGLLLPIWLILLSAWAGIQYNAEAFHIRQSSQSIVRALGGRAESEHAIVYFQRDSLNAQQEAQLLEDIEFRYATLQDFFDVDIVDWRKQKMEIFIYPSSQRQHELMGSRNTLVARPWTHQMHIRYPQFGHYVLTHEMAHLFSAEFGGRWTNLPVDGHGIPHVGLIEGVAVAADWRPSELSVHDTAAALIQMDKAPDIRHIFEWQGFWAQPSGKAYTLMGSFVRWLIDTQGMARFKSFYGEIDFEKHFGQSAETLIIKWEDYLKNRPLSERQLALARYRYDYGSGNRSIFDKMCARTLAELERKQASAEGTGRFDLALTLLDGLDGYRPNDPEYRLRRAELYIKMERWDEALLLIEELLVESLPAGLNAELMELKGDVLWRQFNLQSAIESYSRAMALGIGDNRLRGVLVKMDALQNPNPQYQSVIQSYLLASDDWMVDFYALQQINCEVANTAIPEYLSGRFLLDRRVYDKAVEAFQSPLSYPPLEDERQMGLLQSRYWLRDFQGALRHAAALENTESRRIELLVDEWKARIHWRRSWTGITVKQ